MKRKHPPWHYARRITREVLTHPANQAHRWRSLGRAVRWQIRKRIWPHPIDIPFEGLVLRCYPDSGSASNVFYFTERYDFHEMAFVERYLRPGDGFLDIGANIGTYSLLAASKVGREGRIQAFEALPVAASRARENFALNGLTNAEVHEVAVGDHVGRVTFLDFDVSSTVDTPASRRGKVIEVAADRLEAVVPGRNYALAKLDVEGVELQALRGAESLIERQDPPVWLVEIIDSQLAKHGVSGEELVAWFADRGFAPAWYDSNTGVLDLASGVWQQHDNVFFVADDRLEDVRRRLD